MLKVYFSTLADERRWCARFNRTPSLVWTEAEKANGRHRVISSAQADRAAALGFKVVDQ